MSSAPACQRDTPRGKAWWTSWTRDGALRRKRTTSAARAVASQATSRVAPRSPSSPRLHRGSASAVRAAARASLHSRRRSNRSFPRCARNRPQCASAESGERATADCASSTAPAPSFPAARTLAPRRSARLTDSEIGDGQGLAQLGEPVPRRPRRLGVARALGVPPGVEGGEDGVVALGGDDQRRGRRPVTGRRWRGRPRQVPAQREPRWRCRARAGAPARAAAGEVRRSVGPGSRPPRGSRPVAGLDAARAGSAPDAGPDRPGRARPPAAVARF